MSAAVVVVRNPNGRVLAVRQPETAADLRQVLANCVEIVETYPLISFVAVLT